MGSTTSIIQPGEKEIRASIRAIRGVYLVGIAGRFPNANNVEELWEQLKVYGESGTTGLSPARWPNTCLAYLPINVGCIKNEDGFDADFWCFSDTETFTGNPILRHLLEVIYEAVLDSGLPLSTFQSSSDAAGLYIAQSSYLDSVITSKQSKKFWEARSSDVPRHISRLLGTCGPAVGVDADTNSSLVAVDIAVRDLQRGAVHYAIVAGGNLVVNPLVAQGLEYLNLGSDGLSHGSQSDGVAAIVLTREMLICTRIYSVLLGVGISSDGSRESGISHVDCTSLVELIKETCRNSGVHLEDILYIESSGPGIQTVDEEQMKRLVKTLLKGQKIRTEVICAANTNAIGHCQGAAGLVSIIVSVLAIHHDWVPHCFASRSDDLLDTANHASDVPAGTVKDGQASIKDGATVVISRGLGGTSGCVALVPFRCQWPQTALPATVLLPLYARCDVGFDRICKAVKNAIRFYPEMLLLIEKSVLTSDTMQPARGYMIISPEMEILVSEKLPPCRVFQPSLTLVLFWGDFSSVEMSVDPELWQIPAFAESMKASDKILEELSRGAHHTIVECMTMPYRKLNKEANRRSMTHTHIITGTAVQIGLAETVRQACGSWAAVAGGGLGVLAAAYHDGCLTQKQCIQVAYTLSSIAGCWVDDLEKSCKYLVALVHLKVDEVYRLGPNIYILAILTDFLAVIGVPRHIPHLVYNVEKQVSLKGGQFKPVINSPFFNPHLLLKIKDLAVQRVRCIIPHPKQWSDLALLPLSRSHPNSVTDLLCDAEYIINSLFQPLDQPVLMKQLLIESDFVVMAHIPGCEGAMLSEGQKTFVQLDTTRILHWSPSLLDVLNVLGKVHTLGYKLDLSAIHHQLEFPLDCSVPPLSPLATWDHRTSWPLPQWTEFTCKEKDEFMTTYRFSLEGGSESSLVADILYHSWFAIATRLQNMDTSKPTAVRLFSIVEEQDIMLIDSSTPVFLQAQLGCRAFNIFNEDGIILAGRFEELGEPPDHPIADVHYAYCDVNQDTGHEQSVWTVEWEDNWQLYLWQILHQLEDQTWKAKGDCHQLDKGQRLVTILPEEALFLPQYHAQLLEHHQNSVTVSFEACTGLLRAGGVIFHFPLLPLGLKRRDRKCTEVSTLEESSVEEHGHRHCIFDETTGLVHVTVTKDSMAFLHPGNRFTASTHPLNFDVQGSLQQKDSFQLEVCETEVEESKSCSAPENPSVASCQAKQAHEQTETQKQLDCISCHEVHPCPEKIGLASRHANLNVKTCAADEAEELKDFGAFNMLEKTDKIIVNHTETVWVCNDISVLLFHGVVTATQQQVAGFWSEEYPDTVLHVLVPGWWKPRHQHFLLLWVISMYIMDMVDLETTHTILVYPPFDSLSFTLLWAASDFRCQVFALTQGSAVPEVFSKICPGVAIISQVFWSQQLPQYGSINGCTCVKWITGDITLAMDQLPSSGRLIQCGQPRNSAHVCMTFNKNKTLVCVDPQQAIRGSIARLSQLKDEAFLHLDCLSTLDSATCELILSLEMSDCLGSGFESQRSTYFNEFISLSLMLKVKQSKAFLDTVQISTDNSTAGVDFKRAADLEKNKCAVPDKDQNKLVELAKFHDCDAGKLGLKRTSTILKKFSYPNRIGNKYNPESGMQSNQFSSASSDGENPHKWHFDFESFPASSFNISEHNISLATPGWYEANYLSCRHSNEQVDASFHTTGLPHGMEKVTDVLYMDSLSNCFGQNPAAMQCAPEVPNKLPKMAFDASADCYLHTGLPALGTENKEIYTERQIVSLPGFNAYNERYPSDSEMQEVRYFPLLEDEGYSDKDGYQDTSSFNEKSYEKDSCLESHSQINDKGRKLQLNRLSSNSLAAIDNKMPFWCSTLVYDQSAVQHQVNFLNNDEKSIPVPSPVAENSCNIYRTCTSAFSGEVEASELWLRNVRIPEGESVCKQSMDFQITCETYLPLSFTPVQNIEGKEILHNLSSSNEKRTSPDNKSLANEPSSSQDQQASTTSCQWYDPASQKLGQQLLELLEDTLEETGLPLPLVTSPRLTDLSEEMGQIQKLTAGATTTVEVSNQLSVKTDSALADHVDCVFVSTADFCSSATEADSAVDLWGGGTKFKVQTCATQKKCSFAQTLKDTTIPLCGFDSAPSSFSVSEHTSHQEYPHPQSQTHSVSTPEHLSTLLKNYFENSSWLDTAKTSQTGFEELPDQRTSKHCVTDSMQLATEAMGHLASSNEPVEEARCTSGCLDTNQEKPIECPDSRHQGKTWWLSGHDDLSELTSCLSGSCITQEAERLHGMLESRQSLPCTESSWQEQVRHGEHGETSFSREISMSESILLSNSPDYISPRKPAFSLDPFTIRDYPLSSSLSHQKQSSGVISCLSAKSPWSQDFASIFCDDSLSFGRKKVEVKHKSNQAAEGLFHKSKSIDKMSYSMDVDLGLLENCETLKTLDNVDILSLARQPSQHNLGNSTPEPMCQITGVFLQQSSDDTSSQNCKEYRKLPNPILPELLQSEDALMSPPPVSFHFNTCLSRKEHEGFQAEHQEQLTSDADDNIDLDFAFQFDSHNHEDNSVMLDLPRNFPLPLRNLQAQEIEDESSQSGDSGIEFHLTEEISSSNQHRYAFNLVSDSKKGSHLVYSLPDEALRSVTYDCPPFQQQVSSPYEEASCIQHQRSAVDVSTDQVQSPGGKTSFMQQTSSGVDHVDFDRQLFSHPHSVSDETPCSQSAHVLQSCLHHLCGGSESLQTAAEKRESRECAFEINKRKASDICQKYFEPNALILSTLNTNEIQVQENQEESRILKSDSIQEFHRSKNFFTRLIYQNQEVIPSEGASCEKARYNEKELNFTSNTLEQGALLSGNSVLRLLDSRDVEQRITYENSSVLPVCATTPIEKLQAQKQFQTPQPNFTSLANSAPHSLLIEDFPSTPAELHQLNKPSAAWQFKRPLYLVHPITGSIDIFRVLASKLNVCCIGIQRTPDTPTSSVEDVARHYCAAIKCNDRFGPYQLAGYSYGGLLVFEMARQFQKEGKRVELLLMLDGSPDYVRGQIEYIRSQIPAETSREEGRRIMESHFLLHFMDLYGHVLQRTLVQAELDRSPSLKERIALAVKLIKMAAKDTSILSSSKSQKQKPSENYKTRDAICEAVEKSVDLRRQQKAADFLTAAFVASKYIAAKAQESRFVGDTHLIRIKKCPLRCMVLPADYGLSTLCTGNVKIFYINGDHESIFHDPYVQSLASIIHTILGYKS